MTPFPTPPHISIQTTSPFFPGKCLHHCTTSNLPLKNIYLKPYPLFMHFQKLSDNHSPFHHRSPSHLSYPSPSPIIITSTDPPPNPVLIINHSYPSQAPRLILNIKLPHQASNKPRICIYTLICKLIQKQQHLTAGTRTGVRWVSVPGIEKGGSAVIRWGGVVGWEAWVRKDGKRKGRRVSFFLGCRGGEIAEDGDFGSILEEVANNYPHHVHQRWNGTLKGIHRTMEEES